MKFTSLKMVQLTVVGLSIGLISACATTVKPSYVSPTQYQGLNCAQLSSEFDRIQHYIETGVQTPKRTGMGVGIG